MIGDPNFTLSRWRKLMEDSLTHSVWNSENEKQAVVEKWRNRYVIFLQNILKDRSSSSSDADQKQRQAVGNVPRTSTVPVRSATATSSSKGSVTASTSAKPRSQQVLNSADPRASKSAGTAPGLTNKPAIKVSTKPATNGRS